MTKRLVLLLVLLVTALSTWYTNSNMDKILASRAENYFKENNMPKVQECLEKAFKLGLTDTKYRDLYVNSIINSPLTITAQEKLVKFLDSSIDDGATVRVNYFLYDLKREIYKKYPDNYIEQASFNHKVMRWGKTPITYAFVTNSMKIPSYFEEEIKNAFSEWEKATSHMILFAEENNNPNIIIKFDFHNPADENDKKYIVAYTSPSVVTGKLDHMTINFYLKDPQGKYYTANQVYNTALHEIVHALGFMGHSYNKNDIMYYTKDSKTERTNERETLNEADINTIKLLYRIKPEITNETADIDNDYIPYIIFGTTKEITSTKVKEAQNYIKKAPNIPNGYIDLAEGYVALKDYPKAIKNLEKAMELSDTKEVDAIINFNLAVCYYLIDHNELALEYLNKARAINDSNEARYLLAEIYTKTGKTKPAIKEYKKLIDKNPENIEYTIALTNIYVNQKEYSKARKVLKKYFLLKPEDKNNPRFQPYGILKSFL